MLNKFVLKTICIILIILSIISGSVKSQDIDIPFDFLYTRWINGHYSNLKYIFDKDYEYNRTGDYALYSKKHSLELRNLQEFLIIDSKTNIIITPFFSYSYRPTDNWQIGIEDLLFFRRYTYPINKTLPDINRPKKDQLDATLTSRFINDKNIKIKNQFTPYFYFIDKFVSKGQFILENDLSIDYQNENNVFWINGLSAYRETDTDAIWKIENNLIIGITDNINIKLNLNAQLNKNNYSNIDEYNSGDTLLRLRVSQGESLLKTFDYNFTFIHLKMLPFYYNISFGQNNTISLKDKYNDTYFYNNVYEQSSDYEKKYNYHNDNNRWGILLGYLSDNNFNSNIILADYNNYYHNMLFHTQYNLSLKVNLENGESRYNHKSSQRNLNLHSALGLYDKFEIGLNAEYTYREFETIKHFSFLPTGRYTSDNNNRFSKINQSLSGYSLLVTMYQERINTGLKLKFRSYDYDENSINSWDNISKYDITLGSILKAKQCFIELNYYPIHYDVSSYLENINIFDFTNLSNQYGGYVDMHLSVGLGKQYSLSVDFFTTLLNKNPLRNYSELTENGHTYSYTTLAENKSFDISIIKRLKEKYDLSLQYQYDDVGNIEKLTGSLKFLL